MVGIVYTSKQLIFGGHYIFPRDSLNRGTDWSASKKAMVSLVSY